MGILAAPLAGRFAQTGYGPTDDYWYMPRAATATLAVTSETVMTLSTFYAAVAFISEDVAKIPLNMFEDLGERGKKTASNHPLQSKLHDLPNRYQSALEFREMMTAFAMLRGRAIAEIRPGPRALIDDEYVPLHPDLVRDEVLRGGERRYIYRDPLRNFAPRTLLDDQVFIVRGRLGKAVIDFARDSANLALSQERHTNNLFDRGATFKGAILRDRPWDEKARQNFRNALDEYAVGGARSGRPLLLEDGMTWHDVGMKSTDAELLDSRRYSVIEACRWFRIPPHKIFELERATNNNIERQSVDYVVDSLLGWTERWEQSIWRDLIIAKGRFFAEHNLDGLLRGDIETRFKAFALAVQWGWMTRNEVRAKENMNPIAGLDDPLTPVNMSVGNAGEARIEYAAPPLLTAGDETPALRGLLKLHASDAASRVVRRETAAISRLAEKTAGDEPAWRAGVEAFYATHGQEVASSVHIAEHEAQAYAREHREALLASGTRAMDEWLTDGAARLTDLAMAYGPGPEPAATEGVAAA